MKGNTYDRMNDAKKRTRKTRSQKGQPAVSRFQPKYRTGKCADGHHALNSNIDNSAPLRKAGAQGRQKKGRRCDQSCIDQKAKIFNDYIHISLPPSLQRAS